MKLDKSMSLKNKTLVFEKYYYVVLILSEKVKKNYLIDGPIEILENGIKYYDLEDREHLARIIGNGLIMIEEISKEDLFNLKNYFDSVNDDVYNGEKYNYTYVKTKNRSK